MRARDIGLLALTAIGILIGIFTGLWIIILPLGALAALFGLRRRK